MKTNTATISGLGLSTNVAADVEAIRSGSRDAASLLEYCLDGSDGDEREAAWQEYVEAVVAAADDEAQVGGWVVYHGGHRMLGMGRYSGPHATRAEAEASAGECRRVHGGSPIIERADAPTTSSVVAS